MKKKTQKSMIAKDTDVFQWHHCEPRRAGLYIDTAFHVSTGANDESKKVKILSRRKRAKQKASRALLSFQNNYLNQDRVTEATDGFKTLSYDTI